MLRSSFSITPTLIALFLFCDRAAWLKNFVAPRTSVTTFPLVNGSATHEAWRQLADLFNSSWKIHTPKEIPIQIPIEIKSIMQSVYDLIKANYPQFELDYRRVSPLLELGLNLWSNSRFNVLKKFLEKGFSIDEAIRYALPLTERDLVSKQLGIHGRADQIYLTEKFNVKDLKSDERTTSFLHQDGHRMQLLAYGAMGEETLNKTCESVGILYTKSMDEIKFPFNQKARKEIKNQVENLTNTLDSIHPPAILQGLEAETKCPRCYLKDICAKYAAMNGE